MCQPGKWWWGLLPLALIFALMNAMTAGPVEGDLARVSADEFKRSGLGWASSSLSGRDAVIKGEAPDPESQKLAITAAERAWGVRLVKDTTTVQAEPKPYTATATREGNKITLTGFVPSDAVRAEMVKTAKASFPNAEVVDQLRHARGAPVAYGPALGFGLVQLGQLVKGTASLSDSAFSLVGQAMDFAGFDRVMSALKALPGGATLAKAEIAAPVVSPFTVSAAKSGDTVNLTGYIPAETVRGPLLDAAGKTPGIGRVTDSLRVAGGVPAALDYGKTVDFMLRTLGQLTSGTASLSNDALTVRGAAASAAIKDTVVGALTGALPAGVKLAVQEISAPPAPPPPAPVVTVPKVSPFSWSALKNASGVVLSGYIPSEGARAPAVAAAKAVAGSGEVKDELKVAEGLPASVNFGQASSFLLAQLGKLTSGVASLKDEALSLTGLAPDVPVYEAVTSALKSALPGGLKLAALDLKGPTASPYGWSAARTADSLTLSGFIPSEAIRAPILDSAKKAFPALRLVDQMKTALGAPDGFALAVSSALAQLARLDVGTATLTDKMLKVVGETMDKALPASLQSALGGTGLPAGFNSDVAISVKAPPPVNIAPPELPKVDAVIPPAPKAAPAPVVVAPPPMPQTPVPAFPQVRVETPPVFVQQKSAAELCQERFNVILTDEQIHFAVASARISAQSEKVLKHLSEAVAACPTLSVEIQGHTDADGDEASNLELSNRRALAVAAALEQRGVPKGRLTAKGYGKSQPVAPNDTPENKAKNRRIHFNVAK